MRLYLESASQLELVQESAGLAGAPIVTAVEMTGTLWLQVDRYEEARRAYRGGGATARRDISDSTRSGAGLGPAWRHGVRLCRVSKTARRVGFQRYGAARDRRSPRASGAAGVPSANDALMAYLYKAEILEQLRAHGIQPTPETRPELVHEFVNDLYRYELRRLRDRLLRREVQKAQY